MVVSRASTSDVRDKTLKCLDRLPVLSPATSMLLAKLVSTDCEIDELASVIEYDPSLAGTVLRMANSGIYGRIRRVSSVRHAIAVFGLNALRRCALSYSISRLFRRVKPAASFSIHLFNRHSAATAVLADLLAVELQLANPENAFLGGLLHDLGRLLLASAFPREYDDIIGMALLGGLPVVESERRMLGIDHAMLSAAAAEKWNLPDAVILAVRYHHEPEADPSARWVEVALSSVINQADAWLRYRGLSLYPGPVNLEEPGFDFGGRTIHQNKLLDRFESEFQTLVSDSGF